MKEFVGKTGGRYTYIEDFLNLQDLALSLTSMFEGCSNFVLSGVTATGVTAANTTLSSGYVYISGKIRYFAGCTADLTKSYFIVEQNTTETVKYAQEITQHGRNVYGCYGTAVRPTEGAFLEIGNGFIPRLKDAFLNKYALVLDSAYDNQTVSKKLILNDGLDVKNNILTAGQFMIQNGAKGVIFKELIDSGGNCALEVYKANKLLSRVCFEADGGLVFSVDGQTVLSMTKQGASCDFVRGTTISDGVLSVWDHHITNTASDRDDGGVCVNYTGYQKGTTKFRDLVVYDGKQSEVMRVSGSKKTVSVTGSIEESGNGDACISLKNPLFRKADPLYRKMIVWKDMEGYTAGSIGFVSDADTDFRMVTDCGNIVLSPQTYVVSLAPIKEGNVLLSDKYAARKETEDGLAARVLKAEGKGLSEEDFTHVLKAKLDGIKAGKVGANDTGYVTGNDVFAGLGKCLQSESNLSDVKDKGAARDQLQVYSKAECNERFLLVSNLLSEFEELPEDQKGVVRSHIGAPKIGDSYLKNEVYRKDETYDKDTANRLFAKTYADSGWLHVKDNLFARQIGSIVCIQGSVSRAGGGNTWFTIPNTIGAPAKKIGGYLATDFSDRQNNRGLKWFCEPGSRDVRCAMEYGADGELHLDITYMV